MILSTSQVESFDHSQTGGCNRRWWFERVNDLRPDQTKAQSDGEAGHALLANYFLTGEKPKGRVKMGKAVTGAIVKGELPSPGSDMRVEDRFSGQPKLDTSGNWIPVDVDETLTIWGVPFDGFIDLAFRRGNIPEIWDHKFGSDIHANAKQASALIRTVQMPVYVLSQLPYWPDAKQWRIVHHNVSKKGVDSFIRSAVVTLDQVFERKAAIEKLVASIGEIYNVEHQQDVPSNHRGATRACEAWNGCPHQSICQAFKGATHVALTPEEEALFAGLDDLAPKTEPKLETPKTELRHEHRLPTPEESAEVLRRFQTLRQSVSPLDLPEPKTESVTPPDMPGPACACGAALNPTNGSRLPDGRWKHIGCALDSPSAPTPAERADIATALTPKARKPRAVATAQVSLPLPVQVSLPLHGQVSLPLPVQTLPGEELPGGPLPTGDNRENLAKLFDAIAALIRGSK
jgi:hypothetical protein